MNKIPKLESGKLSAEVFTTTGGIEIRTGGDSWITEAQAVELMHWLLLVVGQPVELPHTIECGPAEIPIGTITCADHGFPLND